MTPDVSVIVINYNTPELVYACLESLARFLAVPHEVIVVDNASRRKVEELAIQKSHPRAKLIFLDHNRGFGSGNNAGAAAASGRYLWFLNSDTELPDSSTNDMFNFMDSHSEIGGISPLLYNDRELSHFQADSYASFQTLGTVLLRKSRPPINLTDEFFAVDVSVAAAFAMPTKLFHQLGGFDENIFMFFEDDDLCYRIRKAGLLIGLHTKSRVIHLQGKSIAVNRQRKEMYYRSQTYFWRKHYGVLSAFLMRLLRFPIRLIKG